MRRGQLGFAVRELDNRLAGLERLLATGTGDAKVVEEVRDSLAQLDSQRQQVITHVGKLDQTVSQLRQLADQGGWSTNVEAELAAVNERYVRLLARLEWSSRLIERTADANHATD